MLAAARAELASGDSGAGTKVASTKPHKKRIRNFTADDRAAHRIFEKKRRELFRERLNVSHISSLDSNCVPADVSQDLAKELPALAGKNPARLSKHDVVDESISRHKFERGACLGVIQSLRAMAQERDELLAEVNNWRATAGMPERQATSTQMSLNELGKLETRIRGQQSEDPHKVFQDSVALDTSYAIISDLSSQPSFSPPTNSIHPTPVTASHPSLVGNNTHHAIGDSVFEPAGPVSDSNALVIPDMALMESQHIPNQTHHPMVMPLKNPVNEPTVNIITDQQIENGSPICNIDDFLVGNHINLTDWCADGTEFPVSTMDFGPDTVLQQYYL
ncbi:hypothetical protein IL306_010098 [Fusarium sp. DS 682]|nr:hypothetical protein IL306_010098 [Fusarium sp. DS 682]